MRLGNYKWKRCNKCGARYVNTHKCKKETITMTRLEKFKKWFYEFKHGHIFLLDKEAEIICETRSDLDYKWMDDSMIQELIQMRVKVMYRKKFPSAKKWSLVKK